MDVAVALLALLACVTFFAIFAVFSSVCEFNSVTL
jgi:hypothetical protein